MKKLHDWWHRFAIFTVIWLFSTSGLLFMANKIPAQASFWDWSHIVVGILASFCALALLQQCCTKGLWRIYFPFLIGDVKPIWRDLVGLSQGKLPSSGSAGLLTVIQGICVLLLLLVGITGIAWLLTQGSSHAMMWRSYHIQSSCGLLLSLVLHALASITAVIDLIRDQ